MKLNAKVLVFDCFGVLVSRQPSSKRIFEYFWRKDENLLNFIRRARNGGVKIGVLSNIAQDQFNQLFSKKEQEELFDFLVLSGEVGFSKPSKEIFEIVVKKSRVLPDEIYFFDDSWLNIESAKKCGINGIIYKDWNDFLEKFKEELCQNYQK